MRADAPSGSFFRANSKLLLAYAPSVEEVHIQWIGYIDIKSPSSNFEVTRTRLNCRFVGWEPSEGEKQMRVGIDHPHGSPEC